MKLQDALSDFLLQLDADGRSIHTRRQYERHIRVFSGWLSDVGHSGDVEHIARQDVAKFFASPVAQRRADGGPRKPTSANAVRTSIRCFFAYLHEAGFVPSNPAKALRRAICSGPPPRSLSPDDERRLFAALDGATSDADRRDRALFRFLLGSGVRISSALGLRVEDVDLDAGVALLRGAKRGRDDQVVLGAKTTVLLRDWLGTRTDGFVFRDISTRHAQRRLSVWLDRVGITRRYSLHGLRHTFAMTLYAKTGDVLLVKEALRHRSICSTMVYATCPSVRVREALGE